MSADLLLADLPSNFVDDPDILAHLLKESSKLWRRAESFDPDKNQAHRQRYAAAAGELPTGATLLEPLPGIYAVNSLLYCLLQ